LYPEPVVAVATIQEVQTQKNLVLIPADYDLTKAPVIMDKQVMPVEKILLGDIKDEGVKAEVINMLEQGKVANTKKFIGMSIDNLYDFFMLFVFMAGAASLVLFFLSKRLMVMMHGVR
jgi:POT family proton-dependent oligopeptide transporter